MDARGKAGRIAVLGVVGVAAAAAIMWPERRGQQDGVRSAEEFRAQRQATIEERRHADEQRVATLPQPFARLLESMNRREPQLGSDGARHPLDSITGVPASDGLYLFDLVRQVQPQRTVEVGFAEGFSTMYLLAALQANGKGVHVAIDPFELTDWHGIGLQKVSEAGMTDRFRFLEAFSIEALPRLRAEGSTAEIIFIDGDHRFDGAFADFVLSDAICAPGCHILLHDPWMPSITKLIAFIESNRPDYARREVPPGVNITTFQKVGADARDWRHYVEF